jgi:hypothetical protein
MNREEFRCGLWKKEAKSGIKYCSGKLKIGDKEYQVTLFNNDKKGNEKAPDFNLIVKDNINTQPKQESALNGAKNSELEQVKSKEEDTNPLRDEVFAEFGQFVVDDDFDAF